MLFRNVPSIAKRAHKTCSACDKKKPAIFMHSYSKDELALCRFCALQLQRKLAEDLCALAGDRHG
jgi:hypothetical protein